MDLEDLLNGEDVGRVEIEKTLVPHHDGSKRNAFKVTLYDDNLDEVGVGVAARVDVAIISAVSRMEADKQQRADMIADVQDARRDSGL
jgi:HSP90 family molecular chaperone